MIVLGLFSLFVFGYYFSDDSLIILQAGSMDIFAGDTSPSSARDTLQNITIEGLGDTHLLPSAKRILTMKPPFEDSEAIRLSDNLITSQNTVVTGYFRIRSKHKAESYSGWMKNMLSLQDAMVIFTEATMIDTVTELRSHAQNRTVIIQLEIDQLPYATLYPKEFWQDQLDRDPEKRIHRSYEVFWIWLSKSWLTTQAIRMNWFNSDIYVWSDIGCFRRGSYNFKTLVVHGEEIVPETEMIQMAHHAPNPPQEELYNDKYARVSNFYHSGSLFAGRKATWLKFHEYFLEIIDRFLMKNMIIVEDQVVLQSTCLTHPDMCVYLPGSEVMDNDYFGLRHALHHGGTYKYWRYNKTAWSSPA